MRVAAAWAVVAVVLAAGCGLQLAAQGDYTCDPANPKTCPAGWYCQIRAEHPREYRCYAAAGEALTCGNGAIDPGEQCDGDQLGGATCESLGYNAGPLRCGDDCQFDRSGCGGYCGDGMKNGDEECDGEDLADATCASRGFHPGVLACGPDCKLDVSHCGGHCGDGQVNGDEVCDGFDFGGETCTTRGFYGGTLGCSDDCTTILMTECEGRCGDGTKNGPEQCDGDDRGGATCESLGLYPGTLACDGSCKLVTTGCGGHCGDGTRNGGEPCDGADLGGLTCLDFGYYKAAELSCTPWCAFDVSACTQKCGDGVKDVEEACDPGDTTHPAALDGKDCTYFGFYNAAGLRCNGACGFDTSQCTGRCGDGVRNAANGEACDGSDFGTDTCQTHGFYEGTLACSGDCKAVWTGGCSRYCGDGVLDADKGEECDGTEFGGDSCPVRGFSGGALFCTPDCKIDTIVKCGNCDGVPATCGPAGNASCCPSSVVPGGTFYRDYDAVWRLNMIYPATVSAFRLDTYEITVGRFRRFVDAVVRGWRPPVGSGKHSHLNGGAGLNGGTEAGWADGWNGMLASTKAGWDSALNCASGCTWTATAGANESRPINFISWHEAYAFCIWDGGFLPSSAEWNYAAAGGSEQRVYPWSVPSTSTTLDSTYAVYSTASTQNVGSKSSKGNGKWAQADLAGNVWEWVLDWLPTSPQVPCNDCSYLTTASVRLVRGGAYVGSDPQELGSAHYSYRVPIDRSPQHGARCARPP
jgi:formylglycine-generating enzyme required for sulfatase activity